MSDHISIVDSCPVNTNGKSMVKRRLDGRNYSVLRRLSLVLLE